MTQTYHHTNVKASRKRRQCDWCGEWVEIGEPYRAYSYRDEGEQCRVTMHPECCEAMQRLSIENRGWIDWGPGEFSRGCNCQSGDCKCQKGIG